MTTVMLQSYNPICAKTYSDVQEMALTMPCSVLLVCPGKKLEYDNVRTVKFPDTRKYVDVNIPEAGNVIMFFHDRITHVLVEDGTIIVSTAETKCPGGDIFAI